MKLPDLVKITDCYRIGKYNPNNSKPRQIILKKGVMRIKSCFEIQKDLEGLARG